MTDHLEPISSDALAQITGGVLPGGCTNPIPKPRPIPGPHNDWPLPAPPPPPWSGL
jgi:hypothetical protein